MTLPVGRAAYALALLSGLATVATARWNLISTNGLRGLGALTLAIAISAVMLSIKTQSLGAAAGLLCGAISIFIGSWKVAYDREETA